MIWEVGPDGHPPIVVIDDDIEIGGFTSACGVPITTLTNWTTKKKTRVSQVVANLRAAAQNVLLVTRRAPEICLQLLAGSDSHESMIIHLSTCRDSGFTVEINNDQLISFKKD